MNNLSRLRIYKSVDITPLMDDRYLLNKDVELLGIRIPKGYVTNGADIPRFLWSYIPPNYSMAMPAVILHDYLITLCNINFIKTGEWKGTYELADKLFVEMLEILNVPKGKIRLYGQVKLYTKYVRPRLIKRNDPFIHERNRRLVNSMGCNIKILKK